MKSPTIIIRAILSRLPHLNKEETVLQFTNGRTTHISEMQPHESAAMIKALNAIKTEKSPAEKKAESMRRGIIAIFKSVGKTTEQAKAWAERQGVKGVKKDFNKYTTGELYVLIAIAEKMKTQANEMVREGLKK